MFTAPALLCLAFTGGLHSVNLHERTRGRDYRPPAWIAGMAHMHKKQGFEVPVKRTPPSPAVAEAIDAPEAHAKPAPATHQRNVWPMKIFFVLVSSSLMLSTLTGMYMGWRCTRDRRRYGAIPAAGTIVPALLMLF